VNDAVVASHLSRRAPSLYRLALAAWVVIALLCVGLFWVDLIADYYEIIVPCTEGVPGVLNDCNFAALTRLRCLSGHRGACLCRRMPSLF
jgi:hypothetical protein